MVFLAAISYTFYLAHGFVVNAVEMVIPEHWGRTGALVSGGLGLALSVFGCWLVHRMYEEPMRVYGVRLSRRIQAARSSAATPPRPGRPSRPER